MNLLFFKTILTRSIYETQIIYSVPEEGEVSLIIYDLLGKKITTLVNGFIRAGTYEINFDAHKLSSGIYLYNLKAGKFSKTKKLVLLK